MMKNLKSKLEPCSLVIFGASGDLTERKLIPALHSLACQDLLPEHLRVLGIGRTELSDQEFREKMRAGVEEHGRFQPEVWDGFGDLLSYMPGGYDDPETYRQLEQRLSEYDDEYETRGDRLFYLAIPPQVYPRVIQQLGESGLNCSEKGWARIIIEKPFGRDLESAEELNNLLHEYFTEEQVFRIDHYLGKETVQNILAFRFANFIFQEVWGRNYVDHVQITAAESVGVGHRAGYYDKAGVLRDMVQNHLLQLTALTAMEPPAVMNDKALRDEKVKVLHAIRPLHLEDGVWGQYDGYRQEEGVDPESTTPTFVALQLYIDNWRWQGVPFFLRTGKSLGSKNTEITLQFKQVPHLIFSEDVELPTNRLSLCIQPDEGIHLQFALKYPGSEMRTSPVAMNFHYEELLGEDSLPDAYERLLIDAIQGDASLFARSDEIERAWELITPLLDRWESLSHPPLKFYEQGSWGPEEADQLIARVGRKWLACCENS